MEKIRRWLFRDPTHIDAHRSDFLISPEELIDRLFPELANLDLPEGEWFHKDFILSHNVGYTGLVEVPADGSASFWGYRKGRAIPSHLAIGKKSTTRNLCVWGFREGEDLEIHTAYPGTSAPREIHDPEISLEELPQAISFWSRHAILVTEGEFARASYL